jgi:hypothetical protein
MSGLRLRAAALAIAVLAGGVAVGGVAVGATSGGVDTPNAPKAAAPAPHVQPFARQLPASRVQPKKTKAAKVVIKEGFDGCDHAYGNRVQCVPWRFPAGVQSRCAWLAEHGFAALPVHGRDRHQLDRNRDGIACGPGDPR